MRLLHTSTLKLEEYFYENVPPYATLSHTWVEGEEVSYKEYIEASDATRQKSGFAKIMNCAAKCWEKNIEYVWIDTCCIDKSSSAELSEAINSMFDWYENSLLCLVYLQDVCRDTSVPEVLEPQNVLSRYPSFGSSRWFTRGWTLQELIAPKNVTFFDDKWTVIAEAREIAPQISKISGVPEHVLKNGLKAGGYCVADKMRWASKRQTTRREDIAYCLLGLFGINMPLLYGEGDRAFERLQQEILKQSDDMSIFLWQDEDDSEYLHRGLLARSPKEFAKFAISWCYLDCAWTLPEHIDTKRWMEPESACWVSNIGIQLECELLDANVFYQSAINHDDWVTFYTDGCTPREDEYVFNVIDFIVGPNVVSFYILLKRVAQGGNQFCRIRPGRVIPLGRAEGYKYEPRPKRETIYVRQDLKILPWITAPRVYGFKISFLVPEEWKQKISVSSLPQVKSNTPHKGMMSEMDGSIIRPAQNKGNTFICGILLNQSSPHTNTTSCLVIKCDTGQNSYPHSVEPICFVEEAATDLCSIDDFEELQNKLGDRTTANSELALIIDSPGYKLDGGRLLIVLRVTMLD